MNNFAILPILIPFISGIVATFLATRIKAVRIFTGSMVVIQLLASVILGAIVFTDGTIVLETGGWLAPYGIILVLDKLAITLVVTTSIIGVAAAFNAFHTLDSERERYYFYTFFFLLIAGVNGAFITGDLFNLFVFFEVLLMASYGMIVLGGTKEQFRESLKYVLINLFSSILFVVAVAFLYSVTGTVNMAHLASRVGEIKQSGILTTIAIMLFLVFATKAALFPLYFWLPKSYIVPSPVVSALFGALLTKVGVYSILRVFTLIFIYNLTYTHTIFILLAGLTMILGVIGALSTNNIKLIVAYNIIPAVGFMLMGIGVFSVTSLAGSIYYLVQDMIIKAALFLLAGAVAAAAGTADLRKMKGLLRHKPVLGWMVFLAAITLAGLPPFSGFIGKYLLLAGALEEEHWFISIVGLLTSLLILLSVLRIFINGFWGEADPDFQPGNTKGYHMPIAFLLFFSIILGLGAEWFYPLIQDVADELADPSIYINTVLKE